MLTLLTLLASAHFLAAAVRAIRGDQSALAAQLRRAASALLQLLAESGLVIVEAIASVRL